MNDGGSDELSAAVRQALLHAQGFPLSLDEIVASMPAFDQGTGTEAERRELATAVRVKLVKWERYGLVERIVVEGFGPYWRWLGAARRPSRRARTDEAGF